MSRSPRVPEALRTAYRAALSQGWTVTRSRTCHLKWMPPHGGAVYTPSTPGGGNRSDQNTVSLLRRKGLRI